MHYRLKIKTADWHIADCGVWAGTNWCIFMATQLQHMVSV